MDVSILLAVAACLLVVFLMKTLFSKGKSPPGPIGVPILGYIPFLSSKPYLDLQRLAKKYGNIFRIRMGSVNVIVLNDFESMKEALFKDVFMGRPPVSPFNHHEETIRTGAFSDLPWKDQRRFSLHMLKDLGFGKTKMEAHIREEISDLLEHLEGKTGKPYCIFELLAASMSNNIASFVFGKRLRYDDPDRQMLTRVTHQNAAGAGQASWQLFFPLVKKLFSFLGIGYVDKINRSLTELLDYVAEEIKRHKDTLDSSNVRDYIDGYLLEMEKRKGNPAFCLEVLRDIVAAFFGAGSETVRSSVEWLLLTVASNQDAQLRIHREIDNTVGRHQLAEWSDRTSMPYTEAFILEIMRWRTTIPINLLRCALTDGEIGGYFIPKGSQIMGNLWFVHHDPEYWGEDAEEFRPERFLTEDGKEVKKFERFIPFSIGKRACPGEPLAKVEVFLYFTSILQRFNVRLPDGKVADFEGTLGIGLTPKPQELIFTKRN